MFWGYSSLLLLPPIFFNIAEVLCVYTTNTYHWRVETTAIFVLEQRVCGVGGQTLLTFGFGSGEDFSSRLFSGFSNGRHDGDG